MHAECAGWLGRWAWRDQPGAHVLTEDQLREILRQSYCAGYEDGRRPKAASLPQAK